MLQKLNFDVVDPEEDLGLRPAFDPEASDLSHLFQPRYYWDLIKRRWLYFLIPFVLISAGGFALSRLLPATYLAEGKILVQSQQIPTELVRPTVTSAAQERIQVIEQRTMTRENLLAMIDKFQLFPDKRNLMSVTELVETMKKNTKIEPIAQALAFAGGPSSRRDNPTIVFTVGFEYTDPQTASRVANELVTRILNADLQDRTSRATDTTKFLAREVQRLQADNAALDAKIAQAKVKPSSSSAPDQSAIQLGQMRADLLQKSALYSDRHPAVQTLKRQIAAMEKAITPVAQAAPEVGLDALEAQQTTIQKNIEDAAGKLAAARLGETLERDQQSEKLEVIEQPTAPQNPIKPDRPKIAGMGLLLALAAGAGLAFMVEMIDKGIRRPADIFGTVDSQFVISIPYISTRAELHKQRRRFRFLMIAGACLVVAVVLAGYLYMPPLDLVIAKARVGLFR